MAVQRKTNSKEARQRAKQRRAVQTAIDTERDKVDIARQRIAELRAKLRGI